MPSPRCRSASMRVQVQESTPTLVLPFDIGFPSAFVDEDPDADEAVTNFVAPGIDKRVASGAGHESLTLDDDDAWKLGSGGKRLELRKMRSGGMVSRLCLKTYLAMADAKMAG